MTKEEEESSSNKADISLMDELWASTDLLFQNRLTWLLLLGPLAVLGDATGLLSEAFCFCLSGIALIPCAERLSFITEQVAEHTNGTIGALLNATFGNAPELLISVSALRAGFYRVVQLAMLGSMLTNMLFVFGVSCLIGGLRWQVQDLRITSGNASVVMVLVATAGSLFPAALVLSGQLPANVENPNVPSDEEVTFCRVNAFVMLVLYICYLIFQLGSHKDEFDDDVLNLSRFRARRNLFCAKFFGKAPVLRRDYEDAPLLKAHSSKTFHADSPAGETVNDEDILLQSDSLDVSESAWSSDPEAGGQTHKRHRSQNMNSAKHPVTPELPKIPLRGLKPDKSKDSDMGAESDEEEDVLEAIHKVHYVEGPQLLSMRVGVIWLLIITLCVSAMSDILVDTIDGFAHRMKISEVFTSMVIIPFFSNVAEQVSAFIFAFRNEMDLVVGVTVGSAIQIATFVLPGSVLIGAMMGRSITLYFHAYETVCLFFSVVVVGAILQGGTTNWVTGAMCVGIYVMMASGIWFHELEDLTLDAEEAIHNATIIH